MAVEKRLSSFCMVTACGVALVTIKTSLALCFGGLFVVTCCDFTSVAVVREENWSLMMNIFFLDLLIISAWK